ncbi:MAG: hypothetical protein FJ306_11540, partial [Planctomycetes bacterium]|nr:hypothetical protein [Planctomycetota bacterium]
MSRLRLLKTVALCFVEAARVTLEHLGVRRLEFTEDSSRMVAELSRVYSDVRRLRDNLQRAVNGFGDTVEVEMTPEDTAVLVACCRRAFEYIEAKLATDEVRAEERRTLKEKQNVIGRWAYELAAKPLLELPLRRLTIEGTEASRSLQVKLLAKVQGIGTLEPQPASAPGTPRMPVVSFGGDPIAAPPTDPEAQGMQTYGNNQVARGPM